MPTESLLAFLALTLAGIVLTVYLLRLQSAEAGAGRFVFAPDDLGGFSNRALVLASVASLFLELMLIRWISSEIRIFAYLKNLVLIACFLGFGVGFFYSRRPISLLSFGAPLVYLTTVVELPFAPLRRLIESLPVLLGATSEVQIWGVGTAPLTGSSLIALLIASAVTLPLFALIAILFIPFGQIIGWMLEESPNGIWSYTVNVVASLGGIGLYTALCFLYQPPAVWMLVGGALVLLLVWRLPPERYVVLASVGLSVGLIVWSAALEPMTIWSPYQKLTLRSVSSKSELIAYDLQTNNSWHQKIIDLSPGFVARHPELLGGIPPELTAYNLPYRFTAQRRSALILGSGMGNDVAAALRNGIERVTAVEIDPAILRLGRRLHFERPYESPRVEVVVDDARSYIQNTEDRFGLIVFSLLDSHTTSSHFSNIRIDNYVYTIEAIRAAKRLLEPGGVFVVKFQVQRPWIAGRLHQLLRVAFGYTPLSVVAENSYTSTGTFFITGSIPTIRQALSDPRLAQYVANHGGVELTPAPITTDDWPYFYQREPGLPLSVSVISLLLLLVTWLMMRQSRLIGFSIRWHFFFLGGGFLLLEAQIISRMALLFGTTWTVNSIVIGFILLLIVAANGTAARFPELPYSVLYACLYLTLAVSLLVPLRWFFFTSFWLKAIATPIILCAPVFFASIIFIRSFAEAGFRGDAMGANLLGALAGGLAESLSLWFGLTSLTVLAAILYLLSHLTRGSELRRVAIPRPQQAIGAAS